MNFWETQDGNASMEVLNRTLERIAQAMERNALAMERNNELMEKNTRALEMVEMANANLNKQNVELNKQTATILKSNNEIFSMVLGSDGKTRAVKSDDRYGFYENMYQQATEKPKSSFSANDKELTTDEYIDTVLSDFDDLGDR